MSNEIISIKEYNDTIAILHLNDEKNKNTFTEEFINLMLEKLNILVNNKKYKAVILQGLTDIFCAGASKEELMKIFKGDVNVKDLLLSELLIQIPVPVIAAMEGGAVGGGLVVALCADMIIMAERSMYGGGFADLGFSPGMGYTRLLQGLVGEFIANEMIYTGRSFKGRYFSDKSLVNYILPKEAVMNKAIELAESIAEKPRGTLETMKYSLTLKKRQLLLEARVHEDFMHKITFGQKEVMNIIKERYPEFLKK
jgi:polyketide biosynthesis enoyl-CoA hydratase PksI